MMKTGGVLYPIAQRSLDAIATAAVRISGRSTGSRTISYRRPRESRMQNPSEATANASSASNVKGGRGGPADSGPRAIDPTSGARGANHVDLATSSIELTSAASGYGDRSIASRSGRCK